MRSPVSVLFISASGLAANWTTYECLRDVIYTVALIVRKIPFGTFGFQVFTKIELSPVTKYRSRSGVA